MSIETEVEQVVDAQVSAVKLTVTQWLAKAAKSKTMWLALLVTILGAAQTYFPNFRDMIPAHWYGPIFGSLGVIIAILRFVTTQPISQK